MPCDLLREDKRMHRGSSQNAPRVISQSAAGLAPRRAFWLSGVLAVVLPAFLVTSTSRADSTGIGMPFLGSPAVGALFTTSDGSLGTHFCTASVIASPAGNLLITAAHCMAGHPLSPAGSVVFAPGYHDGSFPYGTWPVTAEYTDQSWQQGQDPDDDVAILAAGLPGTELQSLTGAETLMVDQPPQTVQVIGYPDGTSEPITCTAPASSFDGASQMVFDCDDYTDGTSGGPFLANVSPATGDGWLIGVIGGYQQGGDTPDISYSPRFYAAVQSLYLAAVSADSGPG
jgi:V8-like Glu-specific endopeptidase